MKKQILITLGLIAFVCVCRLVPHLNNFSPMIIVALFAGRFINERLAGAAVIASMLASDALLSYFFGYPIFGTWSIFTYSALLAILFVGMRLPKLENRFTLGLIAAIGSNLGFWIWTNFGVWTFSGLYHLQWAGFVKCYLVAIPFLQHSTMSAMVWYLVLVAAMRTVGIYQGATKAAA
jgi:hypothetical protein